MDAAQFRRQRFQVFLRFMGTGCPPVYSTCVPNVRFVSCSDTPHGGTRISGFDARGTMVAIHGQVVDAHVTHTFQLSFREPQVTVREIISAAVRTKTEDFNTLLTQVLDSGPDDAHVRTWPMLDFEEQLYRALDGFVNQRYLLLLGNGQAEHLEQRVRLTPDLTITFVRLVPLTGSDNQAHCARRK